MKVTTLGATFINNYGHMLPNYTRSTQDMLREDWSNLCAAPLEKMESLGGRIVPVVMVELGSKEEMIAAVTAFCDNMNMGKR